MSAHESQSNENRTILSLSPEHCLTERVDVRTRHFEWFC